MEEAHCTPYMDDLVVFSESWEDHLVHVEGVLKKLESAGLTANPKKCVWGGKHVEFSEHRAEAFRNYSLPKTKKGLRSFLGAVSFYRRYLRQLASETAKLTPLTSKLAPSKVVWSREGELAFKCIINMICATSELCIPLPEDRYSLVTDASGLGIGGVLQVERDGRWEAATELEALAMVSSVEHFAYYLYGHSFIIYTDHKPLTSLLESDRLNPRLRRLGYKLQGWMVNIEYLPGMDNGFADALSREERRSEMHTTGVNEIEQRECRIPPGHSSGGGGCGGNTSTEE